MLKHLSEPALESLLNIFNKIWTTGEFPASWSEATVIPIPKPGKDPSDPGNYRPISLTSCICKTLERTINERLVWFLEKNKLLTEYQSGFRKQRSTTDQLVRFETFIREGFVRREHVVSIFFDLEKAYDQRGITASYKIYTSVAYAVVYRNSSRTFWPRAISGYG